MAVKSTVGALPGFWASVDLATTKLEVVLELLPDT